MSLFWKCMALSAVCLAGGVSAQAPPGWSLVWADEFDQPDGSSPDPEKWGFDTGGDGWGNKELQYYTSRTGNVRIEGGHLVIEAREEEYEDRDYTSARLLTKDRHTWTYGRFEARIKLPRGQGIWPAFWLLGAGVDEIGWPHCGEIDIMENIGSAPSTVHGTAHGPGYSGAGGLSGHHVLEGAALADDFRVFAVEWEENRIRWFIDGHLYFTLTPAGLPPGREWVFHQAHFLLLNVAVGGNWPGSPDAGTEFPQRMLVDYVRVYARDGEGGEGEELLVTADPGAPWLGYMNVWNLPANGGVYLSGSVWATEELRASFSGPVLTLAPNTITDPSTYWYIGGGAPGNPGAKIMEANLYVERTGDFSGKEVTFTGRVLSNDLTAAHTSVAFIKDFAPDYSSFNMVSAPLEEGVFRITLSTNPAPGRHVQYGFQTTGPNVWHTDAAPFGSVTVSASVADPFSEWISGFDFSAFADPDLSPEGDPDGDGLSNLTEFAMDGNPASGEAGGKLRHRIEELADGGALVLTLPVRTEAVFTGSPGKSAGIDGVSYRIEGSRDLAVFDRQVVELPSAMAEGMPALGNGWSYRSFRLDGAVGEANPAGFLRVRVGAAGR